MSSPNEVIPIEITSPRTDTIGIDSIFDARVSHDKADINTRKLVEVPISEAAKMLGTSERTIWRRIDRGELRSKIKGNRRVVRIPVLEAEPASDNDSHMTRRGGPVTRADMSDRTTALVDLRAILKDLQAANFRIGYLESQLETHKEQVKLLPDLQSKALTAEQLKHRLDKTEEELQAIKQTWWYRAWKRIIGL